MIDNIFKQLMESSTDSAMEVGEEGPSVKALIPQCFPSPKGRYPPENMRELIGLFTTGDDDVLVDPIYRHQLVLLYLLLVLKSNQLITLLFVAVILFA